MLKEMHVELLPYLVLKSPLTMTISMYYMIHQSDTYKTPGHSHPIISTASEMGEYSPTEKGMETERGYFLTLSSTHPETLLEAHEKFHPEKYSINQQMVRLDIKYTSVSTGLAQKHQAGVSC